MMLGITAGILCSFQLLSFSRASEAAAPVKKRTFHINVTDPKLGLYRREYHAFIPPQCETSSCPLLLWFHGWCDDALCPGCGWEKSAATSGYVFVMPEGMADGGKGASNSW